MGEWEGRGIGEVGERKGRRNGRGGGRREEWEGTIGQRGDGSGGGWI